MVFLVGWKAPRREGDKIIRSWTFWANEMGERNGLAVPVFAWLLRKWAVPMETPIQTRRAEPLSNPSVQSLANSNRPPKINCKPFESRNSFFCKLTCDGVGQLRRDYLAGWELYFVAAGFSRSPKPPPSRAKKSQEAEGVTPPHEDPPPVL